MADNILCCLFIIYYSCSTIQSLEWNLLQRESNIDSSEVGFIVGMEDTAAITLRMSVFSYLFVFFTLLLYIITPLFWMLLQVGLRNDILTCNQIESTLNNTSLDPCNIQFCFTSRRILGTKSKGNVGICCLYLEKKKTFQCKFIHLLKMRS